MDKIMTMITKSHLENLKQKNIKDVHIEDLKDISKVFIDKTSPTHERIYSFIEQIRNPYLFKVGTTKIKINFATSGETFQKTFERIFEKTI